MRLRRRASLEDLRRAIQCLPRHTRVAMLEGIDAEPIIVGAYATTDGICPMLAAHRAGGRTNAISFARAWDRIAFRDAGPQRARRATQRELLILRAHLEASLLDEDTPAAALTHARREHEALKRRRTPRPGDPDRTAELRSRPGWAWTRVVRRLDDYERVLAHLERSAAPEPVTPSPPAAGR
jgi:hypothetical protein